MKPLITLSTVLLMVTATGLHAHPSGHGSTANATPTFRSAQRPPAAEYRPQARMLNQRITPPPSPVIIHQYHRPRPHRHPPRAPYRPGTRIIIEEQQHHLGIHFGQ